MLPVLLGANAANSTCSMQRLRGAASPKEGPQWWSINSNIAMGMVFQQVFKQFDTLLPFTPYFSHVPSRPCEWNLRHGTSSKWSRSCKAFTTSVILLRGVLASSSTAAKATGSWRLIVAAFWSHISLTHWWLQSCNKCMYKTSPK